MRIYTKSGDLAFKTSTFPDGQPHFKLETYEIDFRGVTIEAAIKSPSDLITVLLANSVLRQHGYSCVDLDIRYLMGARLDRAIDTCSPFTLGLIAQLINGAGFNKVRILDVHSDVATKLIRNSQNILPYGPITQVRTLLKGVQCIAPDKGATERVAELTFDDFAQCYKDRDPNTGALSGFEIYHPPSVRDRDCLIIDDICDAGGTFVGLTKVLKAAGAKKIYLYVTHGIFSKGLKNLCSVDHVFTTDSYWDQGPGEYQCPENPKIELTVIPVSMKDMK